MKAEYFSDLSISKKITEEITNEAGKIEYLERHVDYKKVTFYIPKAELVKQGINFDEYARYSMFDITPANFSGEQVTIDDTQYAIPKTFIEGLKMVNAMILGLIKSCEKREEKE